jgi:hypothetical protein
MAWKRSSVRSRSGPPIVSITCGFIEIPFFVALTISISTFSLLHSLLEGIALFIVGVVVARIPHLPKGRHAIRLGIVCVNQNVLLQRTEGAGFDGRDWAMLDNLYTVAFERGNPAGMIG